MQLRGVAIRMYLVVYLVFFGLKPALYSNAFPSVTLSPPRPETCVGMLGRHARRFPLVIPAFALILVADQAATFSLFVFLVCAVSFGRQPRHQVFNNDRPLHGTSATDGAVMALYIATDMAL